MISFDVKFEGFDEMKAFLLAMQGKANRPTAVAMTRTARLAEQELKRVTPSFIDRPTRWTLNSTFIKPAQPDRLEVTLGFKDYSSKGVPAANYLQSIAGGHPRAIKPYEARLRSRGLLGPGQFAVPTGIAPNRFNQYGNLPASDYLRILSRLKAMREIGSQSNATGSARSRAKQRRITFFVADVNGNRGIWSRQAGSRQIKPAFTFINQAPKYQQTFPVRRILNDSFNANFNREWERAIGEEMDYWKRKGK